MSEPFFRDYSLLWFPCQSYLLGPIQVFQWVLSNLNLLFFSLKTSMSARFGYVGNYVFAYFIEHFFSAFPIIGCNFNAVFWCCDDREFDFGVFSFLGFFSFAE